MQQTADGLLEIVSNASEDIVHPELLKGIKNLHGELEEEYKEYEIVSEI